MRISFKELLLLKSIADANDFYEDPDTDEKWVWDFNAKKHLSDRTLKQTIDLAIGNNLVQIDQSSAAEDGTLIRMTDLGKKLLVAAEPSYKAKVAKL